jgi:hypothetical protein
MEAIMLTNGKWMANWQPVLAKDKKDGFAAEAGRYPLYLPADLPAERRLDYRYRYHVIKLLELAADQRARRPGRSKRS